MPRPERVQLGLLGAAIEQDAVSKYYRIVRILKGQNWDPRVRSPLTEIGVSVKEGDYILAIDGKPTSRMDNIFEALINMAGKQVRLKLNSEPKEAGSHETVVIPTSDERPLYYYDWVQTNIEKVSEATAGKVGYVHIPDMGVPGMNEFVKYYYPQLQKQALIVDVRGNGGGNVSLQIVERLRREIAMIDIARNTTPSIDPGGTIVGPKVLLIDEFSASDGDIVAYRFKQYKLGPVIGKRTWGGVVGIRGTLPLLDGGFLNKPEFSRYDVEGKEWIMEGHGVDPDIVVDNDPAKEFAGDDEQLNKAIQVILEEMKKHPATLPPHPPYPDKSK
jgi:tricorn protease